MIDITKIDYSDFDVPEILGMLFYPRREFGVSDMAGTGIDLIIPVDEEIELGARFHVSDKQNPNILFFHGNGEIVADYDDLGIIFNEHNINFLPVDYRGYGRSGGRPSITSMMRDCHVALFFVIDWLKKEGFEGALIVMGRSLGSASAVELAAHYRDHIDGLIVESGFASIGRIFEHFRPDLDSSKFDGLSNVDKIATFDKPTLIIHAEYDHIISFPNGEALFNASIAKEKDFLIIPGANHNDIFFRGMSEYMEAVSGLAQKVKK